MINLAFVIPTFNRKNHLNELLVDIQNQVFDKKNINLNTIIVVDGSTDGTYELLQENYPSIITISGNGNWWFTRSVDEGCRYAFNQLKVDFVITLNDDVRLNCSYIEQLLSNKHIEQNTIIGSLSINALDKTSITFSGFQSKNLFTGSFLQYYPYGTKLKTDLKGIKKSITLPTRGTLIPRRIYNLINGFDLSFPQYASDNDFVLRAKKKGASILISYDAVVYEKTDTTGLGSPKNNLKFSTFIKEFLFNKYSPTYIKNNLRMLWRHHPKALFIWYAPIMVIGTLKSYFNY
jgi:GT2 family glycosyltransferase